MTPLAVIVVAIAVVLLPGLWIAQESQRGVVFRLGRYIALCGPGLLFFRGGLSVEETAAVLEISDRTVLREWNLARAWLYREISGAS